MFKIYLIFFYVFLLTKMFISKQKKNLLNTVLHQNITRINNRAFKIIFFRQEHCLLLEQQIKIQNIHQFSFPLFNLMYRAIFLRITLPSHL